jgi:hypothetical protein
MCEGLALAGDLDGAFAQLPIHLPFNEPRAEVSRQSSTNCQRRSMSVAVPHLVIRGSCVRLQYGRQSQLGWRDGWLAAHCLSIQTRQFLLKRFIKQFVPMLTSKHKQFGFSNSFHNLFFLF